MSNGDLNWIANYIWGIADDVLRDLYVRGKYRDVILPMTVLRRLDAVLEDGKQAVLDMKAALDEAGVVEQDAALRRSAGQAFYNASRFTLRDLRARASRQQLEADFRAWLDGFSPNVQDILDSFEFRNQIPRLSRADALGTLIEKLHLARRQPEPLPRDERGRRRPPSRPRQSRHGHDLRGAGAPLQRGEQRGGGRALDPARRRAADGEARLLLPAAGEIESGTYLLYDGACGTGGMLTVAEETLRELAAERGKQVSTHLYGQEINAETYAICKADLLLKGEGEAADNIVGGPEHSTLANDAFPSREFDFMLSNPPYGKSWKTDLERMGGKKYMRDPRFVIEHRGDPEYSLVTRSSDGQMLFLANKLSKMKQRTALGSRIAEVHNGSSLFTGDAGQGESNIRRWIIENDWLEAIVALPLNLFYNTGIATYVWVLTNRKPEPRKGKVQLIDATGWHRPLRKNLGQEELRARRGRHRPHLRGLPRLRGERAEPDLRQRRLRLLEGDGRAAAPHRRGGPEPCLRGRRDQGAQAEWDAERGRPARHPADTQAGDRARSAARPVRDDDRRQACRGGVRAGPRAARHRADPASGGGRDRSLPPPRGPALGRRRVVPAGQREGRLRDQLQPLLLQAAADADPGGDPGGHPGAGGGVGGPPGRCAVGGTLTVTLQRCILDYDEFLGQRRGLMARKFPTCCGGL